MNKITVFIKTYGCALNHSDSELMAGMLKKADFEIVSSIEDADIILINTCTVKQSTETKFFNYLEKIKPLKKITIIAGCIPQTDPEKLKGYTLVGTSQITNIVQAAEEAYHNNPLQLLAKENLPRLNLPKLRKNPVIEIIPICEGCIGECTYCKVKSARGDLISYPEEDIIRQAQQAIKENVKEIWLTAQDTGGYGKDTNTNLPNLLKKLTKLPGDFKIRLGMLNPNHLTEFLDELIALYSSEKLFRFIHIPVQSGNNKILSAMKRNYTVEQFKDTTLKLKTALPDITIATDIIAGFPGETEEQFSQSLDLLKEIKPDVLNISRFWPRPKTPAAKLKNILKGEETKKRSTLMASIFNNIARMQNERWLGWEGEVVIDEIGKDNTFVGRNHSYKPVILRGDYKLGDKTNVKINRVTSFDLRT